MDQVMRPGDAFTARGDDGAIHFIHRYDGPDGFVLVARSSGVPVRRIAQGYYELTGSHPVRLCSGDPLAP